MKIYNISIENMKIESKYLYVIGDIHGEFSRLVHKITVQLDLHDSTIIICGDCGIGFEKKGFYEDLYTRKLKDKLEKHNNTILCVRGNHDDPKYFDDPDFIIDFDRFKTLPSTTLLEWEDKFILCIGGAISTDSEWRIEKQKTFKKDKPLLWWEDEGPVEDIPEIQERIFAIISHEAPMSFEPPLIRDSEMSYEVWNKIKNSRKFLQKIKEKYNPEKYYYGHHHKSFSGTSGKTVYRGLEIEEIMEVK